MISLIVGASLLFIPQEIQGKGEELYRNFREKLLRAQTLSGRCMFTRISPDGKVTFIKEFKYKKPNLEFIKTWYKGNLNGIDVSDEKNNWFYNAITKEYQVQQTSDRFIHSITGLEAFTNPEIKYEILSSPKKPSKVNNRICYSVNVVFIREHIEKDKLPETTFFFDSETGMLLRTETIYKHIILKVVSEFERLEINPVLKPGEFTWIIPDDAKPFSSTQSLLPIGADAPFFTAKTFDGKEFKLADAIRTSKCILLYFWGYG
ncbi:MAG TPA: hypothetical protein VNK96_04555 [Fimbriimonadales bacterium]|nr:hypothetical protein [Fimbriimonadales bacterium]